MTTVAHILDPLTLPLWGSRLIEASAGTGKTWTIAALYLRLVLGHGDVDAESGQRTAFGRPLVPSEILVMTFTRAATRELSDRIRSRLLQAARCFRGEQAPDPSDGFLIGLIAAHAAGPARNAAAWRLAMAAESMDDAAIHTIDAWCQRMLREHAFDSGCLFDEELGSNEAAMLVEAAQDYWRQQLYPLSGALLDVALGVWGDVDALCKDARALASHEVAASEGAGDLAGLIASVQAERQARLATLKADWAARATRMQQWIDAQMAAKPCAFDGRKLAARHYTGWLATLGAWAADPGADELDMKTGATRFTPDGMHGALKANASIDLPEDFTAFAQLMQDLASLQPLAPRLRLHAAARIASRLAELKRQSGTFGFADMLRRLDEALDTTRNGDAATRLRERMLAQYPVALVDEFQDTSPVQSRIFDRLYRIEDNAPGQALLLIGDPKQSIYGFRGADIHSYLQARQKTEGRHYVLGTNHRSTEAVVAAVNHLLAHPENRAGEGAFMYRPADGESDNASEGQRNPLPFLAVDARGRNETFVTAQGAAAAMTLVLDDELQTAAVSRRQFAARCAERIVTLLNDAQAGFAEAGQDFKRLRPGDIAILVRTGREAAAVRRELRRRRVASVYLSDKDSVFASPEAHDLLHWLKAVASPLDVRLARAALATRTAGLSIDELLRLARDDEAFDARSEQLRQLHGVWQQQGVLTMLRRSLHLLDLPARWLGAAPERPAGPDAEGAGNSEGAEVAGDDWLDGAFDDTFDDDSGEAVFPQASLQGGPPPDGERRLTNFLHLAELLQVAAGQLDGEQALIRWLAEQVLGDTPGGDEQVVRLESDADLVQVITMHKAKGLEYPLVFLPFVSSFRAVERKGTSALSLANDEGERVLHLHLSDEHIAAADKERHREDLRLLYVALTRARHAVWVGLAALKVGRSDDSLVHRSAIGYVMHGVMPVAAEQLHAQIEKLVEGAAHTVLETAGDADDLACTPLAPRGDAEALRAPQPYEADFERRWSVGSFSALVRALPHTGAWASSVAAVRDDERLPASGDGERPAASPRAPVLVATPQPWHSFPRGSVPGNFLHDQLEWLADQGFDLASSDERQQQLLRRCERQGWGARADDVLAWLLRVVQGPLGPVGAPLSGLAGAVAEMEFWFPVEDLAAAQLDALCREHILDGQPRPELPRRELRGMLMGFADMVFEHGGKYWVLDYKSNHLGAEDSDYDQAALQAAMATHRYDVQAAVYLLALHRLLQSRLGDGYDPEEQLGGAVYFFLRGIDGPAQGCYHVAPSGEMLEQLDRLFREPAAMTSPAGIAQANPEELP